ncbi:unnamed protein product [Darwinula stevensoni]|uniref:Choline transporter-like protein n=1 Tax=Darwinula stevensoni TaxID=69355 RepID=A0A7R8X8G6_9CRUS|nr:unnamed protein product [Darwinula stevensoni]CAG0888054.1 unnamed protein product [Darwinula stevensoni]
MGCCGDARIEQELGPGEKKGEPGELDDGPRRERSCRDVPCLLLFAVLAALAVVALGFGGYYQKLGLLVHGYDSYGDICGQVNDRVAGVKESGKNLTLFPKLARCSLGNATLEKQGPCSVRKCVDSCRPPYDVELINKCLYNVSSASSALKLDPSVRVSYYLGENFVEQVISDLEKMWIVILFMALIALGVAMVILVLIRFLTYLIVWLSIGIVVAAGLGGSFYLWIMWVHDKNALTTKTTADVSESRLQLYFGTAIATSVVTVIPSSWSQSFPFPFPFPFVRAESRGDFSSLGRDGNTVILILVVIFLRKRISLAATLFQEGGKTLQTMPSLLFQPLWVRTFTMQGLGGMSHLDSSSSIIGSFFSHREKTFLAVAIGGVLWILGTLLLHSASFPVVKAPDQVTYELHVAFQVMKVFLFVMFLWFSQFLIACQHCTIAGAVAKWFFTRDKSEGMGIPVLSSMRRLARYHLGSAAFGSAIIAAFSLVRIVLTRVLPRSEALRCCSCVAACFHRFLKFLNRNAYIEIAIYGESFCNAARDAFRTLASNALRLAAVTFIGDFLLFLIKVAIVTCTVFSGMEIGKRFAADVVYFWIPIAIGGAIAFLIAHAFVSIYEMVVDTLFLCFCEDCERNDGSEERPYYMSPNLMECRRLGARTSMDAHLVVGHCAINVESELLLVVELLDGNAYFKICDRLPGRLRRLPPSLSRLHVDKNRIRDWLPPDRIRRYDFSFPGVK